MADDPLVNGRTFRDSMTIAQIVPASRIGNALSTLQTIGVHGIIDEDDVRAETAAVTNELNVMESTPYGGFPWRILPAALHPATAHGSDGYGRPDNLPTPGDTVDAFVTAWRPDRLVVSVLCSPERVGCVLEQASHILEGVPAALGAPIPPDPDGQVEKCSPFVRAGRHAAVAIGVRIASMIEDQKEYATAVVTAQWISTFGNVAARTAGHSLVALDASVGYFGTATTAGPETFVLCFTGGTHAEQLATTAHLVCEEFAHSIDAESAARSAVASAVQIGTALDDNEFYASALARCQQLFGDHTALDRLRIAVRSVTSSDVEAFVHTLLTRHNNWVGIDAHGY
ncbi:hypothetical protein QM797_08955 [Rhodococcus sp. IEGM 1381]|uniref:hypothetical protein n=1 Tax=Rhodococcus sp. IEGM 1381 TaxID=3047085 RepID=UPI0024B6A88B|nr:hypothetical protein [Rhodococcus sp. IEGM 1381]MDI9894852.1 hypothetical protein [Rhodococcus sp. IEGM 1381]